VHRFPSLAALCITTALVVACVTELGAASPAGASTRGKGATASWAEAPSSPPNFIFPFDSPGYLTTANVQQFQDLMYRPLYWMGKGSTPDLNDSLSLAKPPHYGSGNTVTITLKPYRWSNGETLVAGDVLFWMNMLHAEKVNWAAYVPGAIPDNVVNVVADSPTELTFSLNRAYNPVWFTDNELSQITPMPLSWDITAKGAAPGSGRCSAAAYGSLDLACDAVYDFLSRQSGVDPTDPEAPNAAVSGYGSNPLWQVVDGPWRLRSLTKAGTVTMTRNPDYSGPHSSHSSTFSTFVELPFATAGSEQTAVSDGRLDVGYLPLSDLTKATADPDRPAKGTGPAGFTIAPLYPWALDYVPYNFNSTGDSEIAGKIFSQLYFRQAVQMLVDQPAEIREVLKGYGVPTVGPVPLLPQSAFTSGIDGHNPYPYDPTGAAELLERNGWEVHPGGLSTCVRPGTAAGECGAWIPAGAGLRFTLDYAAGTPGLKGILSMQKASWARAGIDVTLSPTSAAAVIDDATPCVGGAGCTWELEDWGTGWTFFPDVYPSGEEIFGSGAGTNVGSYANFLDDADIAQTETTATGLGPYFAHLAAQVPVIFEPVPAASLTEIKDGLRGVTPQNVLGALTPESWYRAG
jgi:peptide/nickel transport system substrate-binding protein